MKKIYIVLLLLCVFLVSVRAQVGTQFWFASPELALHSRDMSYRLYIFAEGEETDVIVSMPAEPSFTPIHVHVEANGYQEVILAQSYTEYMDNFITEHGTKDTRGLSISSSAPISAYIQMTGVNGEAYTLKGDNALGTEFYISMQNKYSNCILKSPVYERAYSSAQIVATEDGTEVVITPTKPIGYNESMKPIIIHLNRGETYAFCASSKDAAAHLTGTHIQSTKPIAVNSTDDSMSPHPDIYGEDLAADQILPNIICGTDYIAIGRGLSWEGVFITALEDNTTITTIGQTAPKKGDATLLGEHSWTLNRNQTQFVSLGKTTAALYIHASHDIQVFQLTGYHNEAGATQLPSLYRSGSKEVQYVRMSDSKYMNVHILTPSTNIAHIQCNGQPLDSTIFIPLLGNQDWSYAVIDASKMALGQRIQFQSTEDIFHMGVIDATSILPPNNKGRIVMTSCTYGYFSSYYTPEMDEKFGREVIPPLANRIDTIPVQDTLPKIAPIVVTKTDTIVPQDTLPQTHDTIPAVQHRLAVYVEGGYAHLPSFIQGARWGAGYGAGAGLLYELQKNHFIFDVGAGFLWEKTQDKLPTQKFSREYIDTQHSPNTLVYSMTRSDWTQLGQVEIPILFGGSWDHVYLLGGFKIGIPVWGKTAIHANISNEAFYDQYWVPLSQMDNHGLRFDVPENREGARIDYKVDTRVSFEFGVNLGKARLEQKDTTTMALDSVPVMPEVQQPSPVTCRLGVFADMGAMWPIQKISNAPLYETTHPFNYSTWQMNHLLMSNEVNNHYIHNFIVGIKLTILFNLNKKE